MLRRLSSGAAVIALIGMSLGCATGVTVEGSGGASSTSASTVSTGGPDGGQDADPGSCTISVDCISMNDPCNAGTCVNGACVKAPVSDFTPCDDGLFCTSDDACQGGVCTGGSETLCDAPDLCHIGVCDETMNKCLITVGNDNMPCDDLDSCTLDGTCLDGTCLKSLDPVDCSVLDGTCAVGVCDPQTGCHAMPVNDGSPCDDGQQSPCSTGACKMALCVSIPTNENGPCEDGLFCTVNDHCVNAQCVSGGPNPCAPPGGCYIASCDELNQQCTAVAGNNGQPCDDGNSCTKGTTCLNGACINGQADNEGAMCDDQSGCTSGTTCAAGVCGGGVGPTVYFADDFHDSSKGWLLGPEWQIGPAMASSGGQLGADPDIDHTPTADNGVAGVAIGGNALVDPINPTHPFYYLESPPFNTANAAGPVVLGFYRWLNSDYDPYMHNTIDVWNGSSWVNLWTTGGFPSIEDSPPVGMGWTFIQHDLTAFKNAGMKIRFGFDIGNFGVYTIGSWNIDDVLVASGACP